MLHVVASALLALASTLPESSPRLSDRDRGIFPDLSPQAQIAAPDWSPSDGEAWLRVDPAHRIATLYQGEVPLIAYALSGPLSQAAAGPAQLATVLPWLSEADRAELVRRQPPTVRVTFGSPGPREDHDGDGVVNTLDVLLGAKKLCLNKAAYVSNYRALRYPGGDVPRTEGVCTDTLVRALRNAGWDLQREIHEDAAKKPQLYPLAGKAPDANIDHRRIRMMLPWFRQHFVQVPDGAPYLPGDIVLFDTFPNKAGPDHAGIVSDRLGPSGLPLVVNNWTDGYVEQEMDLLGWVPVTHRFRVPVQPNAAPAPRPPLRAQ
ncbi:MAG: DUF1287 domain-containing protein [Myxococcales bacterium]|nr:DUF1287 domain-containing protein [Myxococcales bacterium]